MSLRITPHPSHATSTTNTTTKAPQNLERGAPSVPGLHDTLRSSLTSSQSTSLDLPQTSTHPLETRLTQWTTTQQSLQHTLLRRNFGIAEPLRRSYELKLVKEADSFRPSVLGTPARVHEDILTGRDNEISWEDVYAGQDGLKVGMGESGHGVVGWHDEMERKVGMGKW